MLRKLIVSAAIVATLGTASAGVFVGMHVQAYLYEPVFGAATYTDKDRSQLNRLVCNVTGEYRKHKGKCPKHH